MQIIFAGQAIATEGAQGGADTIEGFMLERDPNIQVAEYIRVTDVDLFDRGNRKRTLTGTITPASFDDIGTAVGTMLTLWDDLPNLAPLTIIAGTKVTTFNKAAIKYKPLKRHGVSVAISVTFLVIAGKDESAPLSDGTINLSDGTGPLLPGAMPGA